MLESIVFYMPQIEHQVGGLCFKKKMKIREARALSVHTVRGFPIMFHARGVWLMVVALQGVKTWAVLPTQV